MVRIARGNGWSAFATLVQKANQAHVQLGFANTVFSMTMKAVDLEYGPYMALEVELVGPKLRTAKAGYAASKKARTWRGCTGGILGSSALGGKY